MALNTISLTRNVGLTYICTTRIKLDVPSPIGDYIKLHTYDIYSQSLHIRFMIAFIYIYM